MFHGTVNHSKAFNDPITGEDSDTVEDTNNSIRQSILPRNRNSVIIDHHPSSFNFRRVHAISVEV